MRNIIIILGMLVLFGCSVNQVERTEEFRTPVSSYQVELEKALGRSAEVDFLKLRMSYTNTEKYDPYGIEVLPIIKSAFDSLEQERYEGCTAGASKILDANFTSLNGHYLSMVCNFERGNQEKGEFHRFMLKGLIGSIADNGDGKSPSTAFTTISTEELRAFIQIMGWKIEKQSLVDSNGKAYDVMKVKDQKSGEEMDLFFDISIQMVKGFKFIK